MISKLSLRRSDPMYFSFQNGVPVHISLACSTKQLFPISLSLGLKKQGMAKIHREWRLKPMPRRHLHGQFRVLKPPRVRARWQGLGNYSASSAASTKSRYLSEAFRACVSATLLVIHLFKKRRSTFTKANRHARCIAPVLTVNKRINVPFYTVL